MDESNLSDDQTADISENSAKKNTLRLKGPVERGRVQQKLSHGRSRQVVVERKRRRQAGPVDSPAEPEPIVVAPTATPPPPPTPLPSHQGLTAAEEAARGQVLVEARRRDLEQQQRDVENAARRRKEEQEAAAQAARRAQAESEAEAAIEDIQAPPDIVHDVVSAPEAPSPPESKAKPEAEDGKTRDRTAPTRGKKGRPDSSRGRRDGERRSQMRLSLHGDDHSERQRSIASYHRQRDKEKRRAANTPTAKISRDIIIPDTITVQELSNRMAERSTNVIKFLMLQGHMLRINDLVDVDIAQLVVEEFGHKSQRVSATDIEESIVEIEDDPGKLQPRPPIVTVMGHVDHGKTSLLDALRSSNVAAREAGGITQHIGAYQIAAPDQRMITFVDTPGHAAFTAMRARGGKVTDIIVLVLAADSGIMPQAREAISHARAASVPIIVAINKIDVPGANAQAVRLGLQQEDLHVESLGGDVLEIEVSATQGTNLTELVELIQLQADLLELKANPERGAQGLIIESKVERGRGVVATVILRNGTLKVGDYCVAGACWGRIRALHDANKNNLTIATPSMPVEILGITELPEAGDSLLVVESDARAREIAKDRRTRQRQARLTTGVGNLTLEQVFSRAHSKERKELPFIVKADFHGSLEAVRVVLDTLTTDAVKPSLLLSGVGEITESDISLAAASGAMIIGFNVRPSLPTQEAARSKGVEIRHYSVIYHLADDLHPLLEGLLDPIRHETDLGTAEVLDIFAISKIGSVAGCRVIDGQVRGGAHARLRRGESVIYDGKLSSLKRFKQNVRTVASGQECGIALDNCPDIRSGDRIECYDVDLQPARL